MSATLRIYGLSELERKLGPQLVSGPISRFMRKSGYTVMDRAMTNTRPNIFDGTVINSFAVDVALGLIPQKVTISNHAEHALYLEKGTRPHFPPIAAIAPWAIAHGIEPYVLARSISRKGTAAHPFLEPALDQSVGDINGFLRTAAREIESEAGR